MVPFDGLDSNLGLKTSLPLIKSNLVILGSECERHLGAVEQSVSSNRSQPNHLAQSQNTQSTIPMGSSTPVNNSNHPAETWPNNI